MFLLTDYELLGQQLNGLTVVEQSNVERAILATSHYTNKEVREHAARVGTKILPKQLAPDVSIKIDASIKYEVPTAGALKKVDLIMVDDNKIFADSVALICFPDKVVDQFEDPLHFLKNVAQYPKDTKICLDNNFENSGLRGMDIAQQLHEQGYTRLYMLSGDRFDDDQIPDYLTVILKSNMDDIKKI